MDTVREVFDSKAQAWEHYTQTAPGRLREELAWQYLIRHLPGAPARVLDLGCGTGGLGLRLAQAGYQVHLLDLSEKMLDLARQKIEAAYLEKEVWFHCAAVENWQPEASFDVVVCHTLLEYVKDVSGTIARLAGWLRLGGVLSLMFVNQYAEPLVLALGKGNFAAAASSLDSVSAPADLFGLPRQLFTSQQIQAISGSLPLEVLAEYGVRVIADYAKNLAWAEDDSRFTEIVQLEKQLGERSPYVYIGRYGQIIWRKVAGMEQAARP